MVPVVRYRVVVTVLLLSSCGASGELSADDLFVQAFVPPARTFDCSLYYSNDFEEVPRVSLCDLGLEGTRAIGKMVIYGDFKPEKVAEAPLAPPNDAAQWVRRYVDYFASQKNVVSRQPKYFTVSAKPQTDRIRALYFKWYEKAFDLSVAGVALESLAPQQDGAKRIAICIISPIMNYVDMDDVWSDHGVCEDQTRTLMEGGWDAYLKKYASSEKHTFRDGPLPYLNDRSI